jgi:hypothetical protein
VSRFAAAPITALHRGAPRAEEMAKVWYHGPGFWLEREAQGVFPSGHAMRARLRQPVT